MSHSESKTDHSENLRNLDLSRIDPKLLNMGATRRRLTHRKKWLRFALSVLVASALWLSFFDQSIIARFESLRFVLSILTIVGALWGGRVFWAWLLTHQERHAEHWASQFLLAAKQNKKKIPSRLERWLTGLGAITGLILILFNPTGPNLPLGQKSAWFVHILGAFAVAGLGGRWLLLEARRQTDPSAAPLRLFSPPKWFKWFTFSLLLIGMCIAGFGQHLWSWGEYDSSIFGAIALTVGVFGSIWIAQRFDELQTKLETQAQIVSTPESLSQVESHPPNDRPAVS